MKILFQIQKKYVKFCVRSDIVPDFRSSRQKNGANSLT